MNRTPEQVVEAAFGVDLSKVQTEAVTMMKRTKRISQALDSLPRTGR